MAGFSSPVLEALAKEMSWTYFVDDFAKGILLLVKFKQDTVTSQFHKKVIWVFSGYYENKQESIWRQWCSKIWALKFYISLWYISSSSFDGDDFDDVEEDEGLDDLENAEEVSDFSIWCPIAYVNIPTFTCSSCICVCNLYLNGSYAQQQQLRQNSCDKNYRKRLGNKFWSIKVNISHSLTFFWNGKT